VCRRLNCTDPSHKRKPFATAAPTRERRPGWDQDRARRRATVKAWLAVNGIIGDDGKRVAVCEDCGKVRSKFVADHDPPLALGGDENGPLRVHCAYCSSRQGGIVANKVKKIRGRG
jgi:hypothetical protein